VVTVQLPAPAARARGRIVLSGSQTADATFDLSGVVMSGSSSRSTGSAFVSKDSS
jgi:hypothetical protein